MDGESSGDFMDHHGSGSRMTSEVLLQLGECLLQIGSITCFVELQTCSSEVKCSWAHFKDF